MPDRPGQARPPLSHPAILLATWFGVGLVPRLPGTAGSLAALPFAYVIATSVGFWGLVVASAILFAVGCLVAAIYERQSGDHDPGPVVIDEVVGQWIALLPAAADLRLFAVAFLAFRAFDILKPWPASWFDRQVGGGVGIMADDVAAGAYAAAVCFAAGYFLA